MVRNREIITTTLNFLGFMHVFPVRDFESTNKTHTERPSLVSAHE